MSEVHWWCAGVAPCQQSHTWQNAWVDLEYTGEPDVVTCPTCRVYVEAKCASIGTTPRLMGADVRRVLAEREASQ